MSVGMNGDPDGLLMDDQLMEVIDIRRAACFGWVHTYLQDGFMSNEMYLFLGRLESKRNVGAPDWQHVLKSGWCFPAFLGHKGKQLHDIFSRGRTQQSSEHMKLKARTSELLSLYSLVRHGVEQHVASGPDIEKELDGFSSLQGNRYNPISKAPGAPNENCIEEVARGIY